MMVRAAKIRPPSPAYMTRLKGASAEWKREASLAGACVFSTRATWIASIRLLHTRPPGDRHRAATESLAHCSKPDKEGKQHNLPFG